MKKVQLQVFGLKMRSFPWKVCQKLWKLGQDDPRRIIHALKVGFSLTLVSLLYLLEPLFKGIGSNAMWAVLTVVVVLEFTAGATLCKGLNRGFGTLGAGLLAFFIEYIANESTLVFQAIFIGAAVFLIGAASTYIRFFPHIKKNYDYGVVIFLLTFNLITVSSYRVPNVLRVAHERFYTIAIGCGICLLMSIFIFPNWSGEDLHNSTVSKLEVLATSIEACVKEYFEDSEIVDDDTSNEDPTHKGYKAILDSKSTDETLASYASWEPRYWRCCNKYPWQQYVKIGAVLRHFGYTAVALHGCLKSEIQTPRSVQSLFRSPCTRVAAEVANVLTELADSIRNHRRCSIVALSDKLHKALQDLNNTIKSQPKLFLGSPHNPAANSLALAAAANNHHQRQTKQVTESSKETPKKGTESSNETPRKGTESSKGSPRQGTESSNETPRKGTESSKGTPRKGTESSKETARRVLRPSLSKIAVTSLEFSEALPFAAFASLLLEMVVRLDLIIEQVEELETLANFKEKPDIEIVVTPVSARTEGQREFQPYLPSQDMD